MVDVSGIDVNNDITIKLTSKETNELIYSASVKEGDQQIFDLKPGEYELLAESDICKSRTYQVTIGNDEPEVTVTINLIGDINGDGKVTTADVGRANSCAKSVTVLSGYEFDCADVNNDGKITTADVGRINSHAKGISKLFELS